MNVSQTEKLAENYRGVVAIMNDRLRLLGFIGLLTCFSGASSAACEREIDTATKEHLVANKGRDGSTGDFPNFRSWLVGHFDFFRKNPNTSELKNLPDFWKKDIQDQELKRLSADYMQHLRSQNAALTCILLSVLDARNSGVIPPKNLSVQQPRESQPHTNQQQQSSQQNQPTQQQSQQAQQTRVCLAHSKTLVTTKSTSPPATTGHVCAKAALIGQQILIVNSKSLVCTHPMVAERSHRTTAIPRWFTGLHAKRQPFRLTLSLRPAVVCAVVAINQGEVT
jgi:hypothetical protein